jgi:hypothetical protein
MAAQVLSQARGSKSGFVVCLSKAQVSSSGGIGSEGKTQSLSKTPMMLLQSCATV